MKMEDEQREREDIDPDLPTNELAISFGDGSWAYIMKATIITMNGKKKVKVIFPPSDEFLKERGPYMNKSDEVEDRHTGDIFIKKLYPAEYFSFPDAGNKFHHCKLTFQGTITKQSEQVRILKNDNDDKERQIRDLQNKLRKARENREITPELIRELQDMGLMTKNVQQGMPP